MKTFYTWSREPSEGTPYERRSQEQWMRWLSDNLARIFVDVWHDPRHPRGTEDSVRISTVYLGVALHGGQQVPRNPLLFETRVLGGPANGYRIASPTLAAARETHTMLVEHYRASGPRVLVDSLSSWPDPEFRALAETVHRLAIPRDLTQPLQVRQITLADLFGEGNVDVAGAFARPEEKKAAAHTPGQRRLKVPTVASQRDSNRVSSSTPTKGRDKSMEQVPQGYMLVSDLDDRVQQGDMLWDETDWEWLPAQRAEYGEYVTSFHAVCRVDPDQHCNKRVRRSRNRG